MAYNTGFPLTYQPYYPQVPMSLPQTQQTQAQTNSSIIWVQGEAGAKSYLVAPNTTVQLWDSERQTIYLKSADASGMPSIKILDYEIRSEAPRSPVEPFKGDTHINISQDDLDGLQRQIDALRDEVRVCRQTIAESEVYHGKSDLRRRHEGKDTAGADESRSNVTES